MSVIGDAAGQAEQIKEAIDGLVEAAGGSIEGIKETITSLNGSLQTAEEQRTAVSGLMDVLSNAKNEVAGILGEESVGSLIAAEQSTATLFNQIDGVRQMTEDAVAGLENLVNEIEVLTDADAGASTTAKDVIEHLQAALQ